MRLERQKVCKSLEYPVNHWDRAEKGRVSLYRSVTPKFPVQYWQLCWDLLSDPSRVELVQA